MAFFNPDPSALYIPYLVGADGACGCPIGCLQAATLHVDTTSPFLPNELNGVYSQADWDQLAAKINTALRETHWPVMPCAFTHLCIPFSPVCAFVYCNSRRITTLTQLFKDENDRLHREGLHWYLRYNDSSSKVSMVGIGTPLAELRVNLAARTEFESHNPAARKLVVNGAYAFPPLQSMFPGAGMLGMAMQMQMAARPHPDAAPGQMQYVQVQPGQAPGAYPYQQAPQQYYVNPSNPQMMPLMAVPVQGQSNMVAGQAPWPDVTKPVQNPTIATSSTDPSAPPPYSP